jgi:hypothetical protein
MSRLYHGGDLWLAAGWRGLLHLGAIMLLLVPVFAFARTEELLRSNTGRFKPAKAAYVVALALAAIVTVVLVGYWGLIGHLTT